MSTAPKQDLSYELVMTRVTSPHGARPVIEAAVKAVYGHAVMKPDRVDRIVSAICSAIRDGDKIKMPDGKTASVFDAWIFLTPRVVPGASPPLENVAGFFSIWLDIWNGLVPAAVMGNAWIATGVSREMRDEIIRRAMAEAQDWAERRHCKVILFHSARVSGRLTIEASRRFWKRHGFEMVETVFAKPVSHTRDVDIVFHQQ